MNEEEKKMEFTEVDPTHHPALRVSTLALNVLPWESGDTDSFVPWDCLDDLLSYFTHPIVFFDITIGGEAVGRLVFELYRSVAPKTCENFRALCTGEKGMCATDATKPLHYKGSAFHRVIPGFACQGGDITKHNGTGNCSIYGAKFDDETFEGKAGIHTGFGCLSMANAGPNTNGCQFFLCTAMTGQLNGKSVVFGRLVAGDAVLKAIEATGGGAIGRPSKPVLISNCG